MSKKNAAKKTEKNSKPIIISVIAVLAVALVLTGIFVVKPMIEENKEPTTVPLNSDVGSESDEMEYVEYKGTKMPREFAEILNQAVVDSNAACKEYGVALELGDRDISMPEFIFYYFDQYDIQLDEINYSIQSTGSNRTGYDTEKMPDEQQCLNKGYTWAEDFTRKAIEQMTAYYHGFDQAIEKGIFIEEDEALALKQSYDRVYTYAENNQRDPAELLAETYTEGITPAMFQAREIMLLYAEKNVLQTKEELRNSYTQTELDRKFSEDKQAYTLIKGRVYPIEGGYDAAEVAKITNEQEFLDYANGNHPREGYDANIATQCYYVNRETVSSTFGNEVGEWMFSDDRVPGEITVVRGMLYYYLVYIEETPFLGTSRQVMIYETPYYSESTEESKATALKDTQALLEEWKANGASEEGFKQICSNIKDEPVQTVRVNEYYYTVQNWIFDKNRKSGDVEIIDCEAGCYMVYYIGNNTEDYDWIVNMKTDLSDEEYTEQFDKNVERNYKTDRNEDVINRAYKDVNVSIAKSLAEEKETKAES